MSPKVASPMGSWRILAVVYVGRSAASAKEGGVALPTVCPPEKAWNPMRSTSEMSSTRCSDDESPRNL
eukprot:CAMPEP_0181255754 /NCGR_PEP_ID=MMETSP1096-20121128/49335_1 /TAXON_ID=156174 ORGANISM="Chrysochromulina ericina, Strain CCMP281" /NCGR_SAMPLE_ID=MMETSP1096 /ASSEMBLY_ACC=CAM_ASM_000453 /LENGTH=67 /DNA_ID=CAMNT_0023353937 /DNA_START=907 /DNA_END=1107 /DNA_ORIENTATION=+